MLWIFVFIAPVSAQSTGTFVDREAATDLRVMTYNVNNDSIFPDDNQGATQAPKFVRVMQALQPDILNLQEIYQHSAAETASLMDSILPLGGGAHWFAHQSASDNVIVSKYPLTMTATDTTPSGNSTRPALALVDLPDAQFDTDFYFMDNHFKCCGDVGGSEDQKRQNQADSLVNWMRDARTAGGFVNLPADTPMAVVGDLNLVGSHQPLDTLITGNIIDEATYGVDSPPDWDGTDLADAHPVHNVTGIDDYTWRNDPSGYPRGRLDYELYTDSVADIANRFVLNTFAMSAAELTATGLQTYDVMLTTSDWDHLPLVVDFRFGSEPIPGDYDGSGYVDEDDFIYWRDQFGMTVAMGTESDGNGDGLVNAADYSFWRDHLGDGTPPGGGAGAAAVPEPASVLMWTFCLGTIPLLRRRAGRAADACL